jgi:two-component system LytT family response regulator
MSASTVAAAARPEGTFAARIVVRDGSQVHLIPADQLDRAEAQDDYVALKSGGRTYLKLQTLSGLAASLDPARFVRVHRSHIVRLAALARLEAYAKGSHVAILADGSRVPVSREGHARLKELLA